ncbi:B-cell linker protein isoform X3 [Xenopus tropicalis]|uniref:B-cell linker protein isoform X3 n=1 Tax=Xenopus tropicalis TaxID=8364 RepID=A0A8J0STC9_XENTR|nr:B-cell linker protein isoform X3 [Xenopus tropicalis]|eukprot:XP_012821986.1 PREDICTED: B-cell linker protein isoform X2 [Xenopus tropicalis]
MDTFNKLSAPAGHKFRQLQKMVHDIKKNEGGLMQKIKKFQNDQVALFCKTGKETWDRIKIKPPPPPTVPQRDYVSGEVEEEFDEWSDETGSEYEDPDPQSDSETYVVPGEEDDNYEPPPTESFKTLPSSFAFNSAGGGYADKQGSRQLPSIPDQASKTPMRLQPNVNQTFPKVSPPLPNQRLHNGTKSLPLPVPKPPLPKQPVAPRPHAVSQIQPASKKPMAPPNKKYMDEEEYIVPGEEEDNYIEPTQDPPLPPPVVNRNIKPVPSTPGKNPHTSHTQAVYEVPENENPPSPVKRNSLPLPRINLSSKAEQECEDEYEACDEPDTVGNRKNTPNIPSPLPRKSKPLPARPPKSGFTPRDVNSNTERPTPADRNRTPSLGSELPLLPHSAQKLPIPPHKANILKPPEVSNRYVVNPSRKNSHSSPEEEAGVLNKDWYAASCDRKTAEEALYASCKDGSYLVRQSSGQDPKQPYTLVVFYNRKVYNIPVRFIEETRQFALGREKSGEEKFSSVAEMITCHQRMPLVLIDSQNNTKDSTKLKQVIKVP